MFSGRKIRTKVDQGLSDVADLFSEIVHRVLLH